MHIQLSMKCGKTHGVLITYSNQGKMQEHENCADDMQMKQTDKSWWTTSQTSLTKQSHNSIAQERMTS